MSTTLATHTLSFTTCFRSSPNAATSRRSTTLPSSTSTQKSATSAPLSSSRPSSNGASMSLPSHHLYTQWQPTTTSPSSLNTRSSRLRYRPAASGCLCSPSLSSTLHRATSITGTLPPEYRSMLPWVLSQFLSPIIPSKLFLLRLLMSCTLRNIIISHVLIDGGRCYESLQRSSSRCLPSISTHVEDSY